MSDHTDDGFPRERYEGPMASAAKAETKECEACMGTGITSGSPMIAACATCSGSGIVTTGVVVGVLPSTPDPVTDKPHEPTITTTHKDASFEARDRYAALEAERDALRGKLDVQQEFIDDYRKTIDRLRTEVERLKGERDSVKHNFASLVAATEQGVDRIRAEKYAAVIEAMHAERDALSAYYLCHHNALAAQAAAGYQIGEAPTWQAVKDLVKEADHD